MTEMSENFENRPPDDSLLGPSRRTVLASERTWLAWFRTGIAVATAAIAVGGVIPRLVDSGRWGFIVLGFGYAVLAAGIFAYSIFRYRKINWALDNDEDVPSGFLHMAVMASLGGLLAIGTLILITLEI